MKKEEENEYVKNGKRLDGRKVDELREIQIKVGVIPSADGSCYLEWGQNKVIVAVHGPREYLPKHLADPYQATINYTYRMASFSVPERKNPKPARRELEISKVSAEALQRACLTETYPNTTIDVFVEILDSNAGTRVAALTAASCALADAGIPMRDLVTAVSVGRAGGHLIVDLNKEEEDAPDAVDIAMGFLPNSEEIVLLQMDGMISNEDWKKLIKLGLNSAKVIYEKQKEALKENYLKGE